jgi:hypothetical protein
VVLLLQQSYANPGFKRLQQFPMPSSDVQDFFESISAGVTVALRRRRPVFITGRFRSGTTALWNILRQEPTVFGVYEPMHDNLREHLVNELPTDPSHHGVTDYFRELRPHREEVLAYYRPEFGTCRLALAAGDAHPELKAYLDFLIQLAGKSTPVLKFVRMDYRLPWLRRNFPDAVIVHIHRQPRAQWRSMTARNPVAEATARGLGVFQLNAFAASLLFAVPEIMTPGVACSYERAYYLSRISRAVGEKYADLTIDFDREFLLRDEKTFSRLAGCTGIPVRRKTLDAFLDRQISGRATNFQDDAALAEIEQRCDAVLERRGLLRAIADGVLEKAWPVAQDLAGENIREALDSLSLCIAREQSRSMTSHLEHAQTREVLRQALSRLEILEERLRQAETIVRETSASPEKLNA